MGRHFTLIASPCCNMGGQLPSLDFNTVAESLLRTVFSSESQTA